MADLENMQNKPRGTNGKCRVSNRPGIWADTAPDTKPGIRAFRIEFVATFLFQDTDHFHP